MKINSTTIPSPSSQPQNKIEETILGKILSTRYKFKQNSWAVVVVQRLSSSVGSKNNLKTFATTGIINPLVVGASYTFVGSFQHNKYGEQFVLSSCSIIFDQKGKEEAFKAFIQERTSAKMMKLLFEKYKDCLLDGLKDGKIQEIDEGFGRKLYSQWLVISSSEEIIKKLGEFGISQAYHVRIIERWGNQTIKIIEEDPYVLTEILGIGFLRADEIAMKMGLKKDDPRRVKAAIIF